MKFNLRLQEIMKNYQLSTTELADKILVPKATISHLIAERNKPSLEFIMKLHNHFPELNLEWLIYGKEPVFLKSNSDFDNENLNQNTTEFSPIFDQTNHQNSKEETTHELEKMSEDDKEQLVEKTSDIFETKKEILSLIGNNTNPSKTKEIESIVIFYSDGSFKNYKPE